MGYLNDEQKKEAKQMENEGWTQVEIRDAFRNRNFVQKTDPTLYSLNYLL